MLTGSIASIESDEEAPDTWKPSTLMLSRAERLFAVWDGQARAGLWLYGRCRR